MNPAVTPLASSQSEPTVRRHLRGSAGTHERFITSRFARKLGIGSVLLGHLGRRRSIPRALHSRCLPGNRWRVFARHHPAHAAGCSGAVDL